VARRRKGRQIDGILVLDKPQGVSSNQALQAVKRLYFAAKAGHTGSLDPLATGVLPLCFGEATKFSRFLLDADKAYTSTFVLGAQTDTGDSEGSIIATADASHVSAADVEKVLPQFRGSCEQVPPMYSALKQDGQPLYKLARAGQEVERKPRPVVISALDLLAFRPGEQAELDVHIACSKGTYVRTLAEDIGEALGCGAHVSALRRTKAGPFTEESAVSMTALEGLKNNEAYAEMDALLLPADAALGNLPMVQLTESGGFYIRQGQPVLVPNSPCSGMVRVGLESGEFLGVGEILDDGRVAPRRLIVSRQG
jgi:tRNA pseudouridine55 synthase